MALYNADYGSSKFAVINPPWGNTEPIITFDGPVTVERMEVTNTTYTALSMRDGDAFAKKFTAEDEDFFSVNFEGFDADGINTPLFVAGGSYFTLDISFKERF